LQVQHMYFNGNQSMDNKIPKFKMIILFFNRFIFDGISQSNFYLMILDLSMVHK
jgi:hypothetical protein